MCATCGCSESSPPRGEEHRLVALEQDVLGKNDATASRNRTWLRSRGILAVNLMSSPGSGKTTLLERTVRDLGCAVSVVEGDQETEFDARRIRATGTPVVQINTGAGCHLDAAMLERALTGLGPQDGSIVFVENVGNLVCPALFDLGEERRAVIMSVTEGEDKPLKYPHMFASSDLVVVNKLDLAAYVDFELERFVGEVRKVRPDAEVMALSAKTGEGIETWYAWLRHELAHVTAHDHHHDHPHEQHHDQQHGHQHREPAEVRP